MPYLFCIPIPPVKKAYFCIQASLRSSLISIVLIYFGLSIFLIGQMLYDNYVKAVDLVINLVLLVLYLIWLIGLTKKDKFMNLLAYLFTILIVILYAYYLIKIIGGNYRTQSDFLLAILMGLLDLAIAVYISFLQYSYFAKVGGNVSSNMAALNP